MAGKGKRFQDKGYNKPKPFIDVLGKPMVVSVVNNLLSQKTHGHRVIFVCLDEFLDQYGYEFRDVLVDSNIGEYKIVPVKSVTEGAACTCLLAKDYINNDEELVIANCDQLVLDPDFLKLSVNFYRDINADGGVLSFLNSSPKWSYARIHDDKITEIVEKQVVSNIATVGIYYYKTGRTFVESASSMIRNNFRVNGEFYVAPTYNDMIVRDLMVVPYMVNRMVGLGTPEDLEKYVNEVSKTK